MLQDDEGVQIQRSQTQKGVESTPAQVKKAWPQAQVQKEFQFFHNLFCKVIA